MLFFCIETGKKASKQHFYLPVIKKRILLSCTEREKTHFVVLQQNKKKTHFVVAFCGVATKREKNAFCCRILLSCNKTVKTHFVVLQENEKKTHFVVLQQNGKKTHFVILQQSSIFTFTYFISSLRCKKLGIRFFCCITHEKKLCLEGKDERVVILLH